MGGTLVKRLISQLLVTSRLLDLEWMKYVPFPLCSLDHVNSLEIVYHSCSLEHVNTPLVSLSCLPTFLPVALPVFFLFCRY